MVSPPSTTVLAQQRTDLALDRSYLASERTLMGWIRTALAMISFGFTIGKLGEVLSHVEVQGLLGLHTFSIKGIADTLVVLGTAALVVASRQHWQRTRRLRAMGLRHRISLSLVVAIVLSLLGGLTFTALVMSL